MKKNNLFDNILDKLEEGIIYVNKFNKIELINQKSKDILGITLKNNGQSHPEGHIEPGDIVILADNMLGEDDGKLSPKDLLLININNKDIKKEDIIIAIGVYKNSEIKPIYKYWRKSEISLKHEIKTEFLNFNIKTYIDVVNKKMNISVNGELYEMSYIYAIGHMVLIDGKTGAIKFYQDKGYTLRKENICNILHGTKYFAKNPYTEEINVTGKDFNEIIEYGELSKELSNIFNNKKSSIKNQYFEINKRPILCSFDIILINNQIDGVLLKIHDISELEKTLRNRNNMLNNIVQIEENIRKKTTNSKAEQITAIAGNSQQISEVKYLAYKASKIKSTVLITGESGTGKSLLAKEIHKLYNTKSPFIHVNCTAIPQNLFESELFGYEKGSFTGALSVGKIGYFELANGGTIFLDEIGELPNEIQVKLLHVLQEKCFYKIGSNKPIKVNVRIITATNKDLEEEIKKGNFRQDLFYRINVFPIFIPPLRERKRDIYVLINNILNNLAIEHNSTSKQLSGEALNKLLDHDWPGNVRELENVLERAFTICETNIIHSEHMNVGQKRCKLLLKDIIADAEKNAIIETLDACNYNKKITMRKLGISKSTFYEKLNKYKIDVSF